MNPWSKAETGDESPERDLFAQRARALAPAVVPSLASVLRAAEAAREARETRRARGQASVALVLAAACMMAALTRLPRTETRGEAGESIAAEIDASAGYPVSRSIAQDVPREPVCSMEDDILAPEEPACFASAPLFTPAPAFTRPSISLACDSNQSCAIMTP